MTTQGIAKPRVLIIGLDGASFNFVQPWLENGSLPNLRRLVEEGCSGELESCLPPVTMPAWRVLSTGKYPGKLGVFWHQQLDPVTLKLQTPTSRFFTSADYWDYLNAAGVRTGILGMPDTFPPRPVDGFLVAGGPSAAEHGYAYPAELERVIERIGYKPHVKADYYHATHDSPIVHESLDVIRSTFDTATYLIDHESVDLLQVVSFDINRLQHFFFDEEPTRQAWQIMDRWLGQVRDRFNYVAVASDHGTERLKRAFFLNVWLRQSGYLTTRFHPIDLLPRVGVNRNSVAQVMTMVGLTRLFSHETLLKYGSLLPNRTGAYGEYGNQQVVQRIDWTRTRAFALPQGPLYINRKLVQDERAYENLRDELIGRLEALREPESQALVFKKVYRREEIYQGEYVDRAPHLLALTEDAYHNRAGLSQSQVFADTWRWKGNNRRNGLFILAGPGVKPGRLAGIRLADLAPTVLHLYGLSRPEDMDGCVIEAVRDVGAAGADSSRVSPLAVLPSSTVDEEFDDVVRERLKSLGYL
jgi:predicted AlkP superfamily phosphohydrolase/phosphomutase